jgi:copper resistance protein B
MTYFRTCRQAAGILVTAAALVALPGQQVVAEHAGASAIHGEDPVLARVVVDQMEWRDQGNDPTVVEGEAWLGYDLDKLWLKLDSSYSGGRVEELELQALYSRGITPFWDLQLGVRHDDQEASDRNWAVLGLHGLAPWFIESDVALFLGESGDTALRVKAEYQALLTQRLILSPELKVDLHGQDDARSGTGSGLSSVTAGLRLRYEIHRQFAPYIGIRWKRRYGRTADYYRNGDHPVERTHWVAGIRFWF